MKHPITAVIVVDYDNVEVAKILVDLEEPLSEYYPELYHLLENDEVINYAVSINQPLLVKSLMLADEKVLESFAEHLSYVFDDNDSDWFLSAKHDVGKMAIDSIEMMHGHDHYYCYFDGLYDINCRFCQQLSHEANTRLESYLSDYEPEEAHSFGESFCFRD